ncbi:MAG: carbon-nitrogen family hydrolase [Anaerolineales bacterium]
MTYNIALAQLSLPQGKPEDNYQAAAEAAREAAERGAEVLLLPELWASGYDLENCAKYASPLDKGWFDRMATLAKENQIAVGGSLIEKDQGGYYNTFVLLDRTGQRLGAYRKIHLFRFLEEEKYLKGGDQLVLLDSPWGKVALATCYDLRFPEIFRAYAVKGAEIIFLVSEWPRKRIAHWDILLQARAVENQCFIAAVNKVGTSKGAPLGGRSAVIDPMGKYLVKGDESPAVLVAEIDLGLTQKTREWMPVLQDRNPGVYGS